MDETIEKDEFADKNNNLNIQIHNIENVIKELQKTQTNTKEYIDNLKDIERYFLNMFTNEESMTRNQIDEMVKTLVDRVEVEPINEISMNLTIVLKAGDKGTLEYVRQGTRYACVRRTLVK